MNLSRSDRSNIILGGLIAFVTLLAAITPAHCQSPLPSWNDGANKRAIIDFVNHVTKQAPPDFVRNPVFDEDDGVSGCRCNDVWEKIR